MARESKRVSAVTGQEMLRSRITVERVKFRGLLMNGDLSHAYLGSNIVSTPEQLISIALRSESQEGPVCNLFYTSRS
jgi:hypothetical protein